MEFARCFACMAELETPGGGCPRCGFDNTKGAGEQPEQALPCGTVLAGRYVVGRMLGQGGFGISYIGWNLSLEVPVCIKEYFPAGAAMRSSGQSRVLWSGGESAEELKRGRESFVKEARKAVRLRDLSSVVTVWDVFYENETAYIAMDYIEGETLKSHLVRRGAVLGERECVELMLPVMRELGEVHARGIIHRDIKPDNLMLTPRGSLVLLDLGAAKDLRGGSGQSSFTVASQGFSPREQYRKNGKIGPWTDVYALCATMVWCLTGKIPPTPMDREDGEEIDLSGLSPAMRAALEKGLALRVEDRIQSMGELAEAIEGHTPERKPAPEPKPKPTPKPQPKPEPKPAPEPKPTPNPAKKSRLPLILGAAAVLALILVFALTSGGKESPALTASPKATATATAKPTVTPTPVPTPSGEPLSAGKTENGLKYKVFADCVQISGCDKSVVEVNIPAEIEGKPVTTIGVSVFLSCEALTKVTIPDGVTSIGENAFRGCESLASVTIPDSVSSIGKDAFYGCNSLESINIPNGITVIEESAFYHCSTLTEVVIPDGVTSIGKMAFYYCTALERVTIPKSVTNIGDHAFAKCALKTVTIPEGVTSIEEWLFAECQALTSIRIPNSVTIIGASAFYKCSSLTSVTIPESVNRISDSAFLECSALESVQLPNSLVNIESHTFSGCVHLKSIMIPENVTMIDRGAFSNCKALTDVFYAGTGNQWKSIKIGESNSYLTKAAIHYNYQAG